MDEQTIQTETPTETPVETTAEAQVDVSTEAPVEPAAEAQSEQSEAEDFSWFKSLHPDTQKAIKEGGVNWDRQINRRNKELVETRRQLEKVLAERTEKPAPPQPTQKAELTTFKAILEKRVEAGEMTAEYASALLGEAEKEISKPSIEEQIRPVMEKYLDDILKMQSLQKAQEDLVLASKGTLDSDKAFGILNGLTSIGLTPAQALEEAKKIFKTVETDTVKKEVKQIMEKPKTKIISPGTTASGRGSSQDDVLARVKAKTLADAKVGV